MLTITKKTRQHELGTVADSVDCGILDHNPLVANQQCLQGLNDVTEVLLVTLVIPHPLGIQNIVQSDQVIRLGHSTGAHTTELLHVSTNSEKETKMDAKGSDVGSGLAGHPEHGKVAVIVELHKLLVQVNTTRKAKCTYLNELRLIDGSNSENTLDGRNQWARAIRLVIIPYTLLNMTLSEELLTVAGRENQ